MLNLAAKPLNKRIVFEDNDNDGGTVISGPKSIRKEKKKKKIIAEGVKDETSATTQQDPVTGTEDDDTNDYFAKRAQKRLKQKESESGNDDDAQKRWFNVYPKFNLSEEPLDMKENEQMELYNLCKTSFDAEMVNFVKRNPTDARWMETALHKGTAKDRANAGALLVTSNALGNLDALTTLIGFTKISNKSSSEVIVIVTDLWREVLLPPHRKLLSLQMRGADWKALRKNSTLSKDQMRRIYAYWHFENELKDQYFEFLKNLQQAIQTGQENNKNVTIVSASQLLAYAPEKEQMLLTMIINKLGDPIAKIASKALHHLSDVAHRHPNMCGVIVSEAEKLLFRNNISERAQHFALCFLATIAPAARSEVSTKLVQICFALFNVSVQKGAVNSRTMQAILRCLQNAILEARPMDDSGELLSKEMQDTIYRLVHLADIRISTQTLGLLLQLNSVQMAKADRFYNALYKKLLDLEVTSIGVKTAAHLLHIVHRAIHLDPNVERAKAFIKRLLQVALHMPPQMAAGCLIVLYKLLRSRKELTTAETTALGGLSPVATAPVPKISLDDSMLDKFDSDGEEKYKDAPNASGELEQAPTSTGELEKDVTDETVDARIAGSWHHAKVEAAATAIPAKVREIAASKYDPYHRVPAFAGAEFALRTELLLLREHFHPTVQVFADNILNEKRIDYYGDPLRDFGLPHFLERFAFKNPKKLENQKTELPVIAHKRYTAFGARGKSVKSLTKANCTEDEMFIFNFLEQKRQQSGIARTKKNANRDDDDDDDGTTLKAGDVDDDEFESYLDGFFGKKAKAAAEQERLEDDDDNEDLDFLTELGGELKTDGKADKTAKSKKIKKKATSHADDDDDDDDVDGDWGDDDDVGDGDISDNEDGSVNFESDDAEGSISLDGNDDDEDDDVQGDDDEDDDEDDDDDNNEDRDFMRKPHKKAAKSNEKFSFAKRLKHSDDMSSLFAAADDFAELLEETGKSKGQGTTNSIFNRDKSSDKQMKWEVKRHSNAKTYTKKRSAKFGGGGGAGKKRKH